MPAFLNVVDIAGLVKGASEGQGLGNAFLSHIKACDAMFHLCRTFEDKEITHIEGEVDPVRDLDIINEELRLKDEEFFMKAFVDLEAKYKRGEKKLKQEYVRYNIPRSGWPIWMWWILKSLCIQRFFHHENQTVQIIFTKNFVNPKIFVKLISLKKPALYVQAL